MCYYTSGCQICVNIINSHRNINICNENILTTLFGISCLDSHSSSYGNSWWELFESQSEYVDEGELIYCMLEK